VSTHTIGFTTTWRLVPIIQSQNWLTSHIPTHITAFFIFIFGATVAHCVRASSCTRFPDYTQLRIIVGRTPVDEWLAPHRNLYLTTHNTHNVQKSITPVRFGSKISAGDWPQIYALDCAATGTGSQLQYEAKTFMSHTITRKSILLYVRSTTSNDYQTVWCDPLPIHFYYKIKSIIFTQCFRLNTVSISVKLEINLQ
jgi:hypothetical protein